MEAQTIDDSKKRTVMVLEISNPSGASNLTISVGFWLVWIFLVHDGLLALIAESVIP